MTAMYLKCNKTGRVLFSQEEATAHAEVTGSADFAEVAKDAKVWVDKESGKPFFSEAEIDAFKKRTRQTDLECEETTLEEYHRKREEKLANIGNDPEIVNYCKDSIFESLVTMKGYGRVQTEKSAWFTSNKGVKAAIAWLDEHKDDEDLDKPIKLKPDDWRPMEEDDTPEAPVIEVNADATENSQNVKDKANQDLLKQLTEMGFTQLRAEKALYFSDNAGLDHAVNWLTEHSEDADIDQALVVTEAPPKPKLTKEEAEAKAEALRAALREKKAKEEAEQVKMSEKQRIEMTKMAAAQQAANKDAARKQMIADQLREKEESEKHRAELREQMRLDYIERFGKEPPTEEEKVKDEISSKSRREQIRYYLGEMKKKYKDTDYDKFMACVTVMNKLCGNIIKDPREPKFKAIKFEFKMYQDKIAPIEGAKEFLIAVGFKENSEGLVIEDAVADRYYPEQAVRFLEHTLKNLKPPAGYAPK